MKILVTGGAGFIGSHLCEYLLDKGDEVVCVDNYFTGKKENIQHLLNNNRFESVRHDIINPLFLDMKVDQIYNLACPASPIHYQVNKIRTIKACTVGMVNMLGVAKANNARILQASTSEVYGDPKVHPQPEHYWGNVNTLGPRACFSDDIEILTEEGWKLFKDLKKTEKVLTLNKNHKIEYHVPKEIIKQRYIGDMIEFKNYQCDILVTPNHKIYVKRRNDKTNNKFELLSAFKAINWDRAKMLKVAKYDNKDKKWFYFP
ncbi:MAG: GDP-mannose 4,6-dehydratase, partial [Nanoarchaeota archaeon]|nr:GDP-mannose 4,6-dehydratase [Nanoarchaeota archaeon]